MSYDSHDPAQSGRSLRAAVIIFLLPAIFILGLIYTFVSHTAPTGAATSAQMPEAVAQRIQKVGTVDVTAATTGSGAARSGQDVFTQGPCTGCHTAGALGSPKFGDKAAWAPRIAKGYDALLQSALHGKGNMPAQGNGAYSDVEVGRALVYMANAGGANFPEPKAPAAK